MGMRLILPLLVFLLAATPACAVPCAGFTAAMNELEAATGMVPPDASALPSTVPFEREFDSVASLAQWAETSTFGGGRTEEATLAGRRLMLVFRSHTSGIKSSDIGIYVLSQGRYRFVKGIGPVRSWIETRAFSDRIVFYPEGGGNVLLTLTPDDFGPDLK